jgi:alanine dehydrogenase
MLTVGNNVRYYGVDHSPSYLWDSATWEISEALLPYLRPVLTGPAGWDANQTVRRAIEIRDGVIQNQRILSFQHRLPDYPHLQQP